jgi:hypothetical protein
MTNNPPSGCRPSNHWVLSCKQQIIALSNVCNVNNTNVLEHKVVVFSLLATAHLQSKVCNVNNTNVLEHKIVVFSLVATAHLQP